MEPSGRNGWQPVANAGVSKTAQTGRSATDGKEGVDGSSPSEGLTFFAARGLFAFARPATILEMVSTQRPPRGHRFCQAWSWKASRSLIVCGLLSRAR